MLHNLATAVCAAIALSGCSTLGSGLDRDKQMQQIAERWRVYPELQLEEVRIKWLRVSQADLQLAAERMFDGDPAGKIYGFAFPPTPDDPRCLILAPEPKKHGDSAMEVFGHELLHCFSGRWHVPSHVTALGLSSGMERSALSEIWRGDSLAAVRDQAIRKADRWFPAQADEIKAFFD